MIWGLGNVNGGQEQRAGQRLTTNSPKSELGAGTGARLGAGFGAGFGAGLGTRDGSGVRAGFSG